MALKRLPCSAGLFRYLRLDSRPAQLAFALILIQARARVPKRIEFFRVSSSSRARFWLSPSDREKREIDDDDDDAVVGTLGGVRGRDRTARV
jgi:hypothetical protein